MDSKSTRTNLLKWTLIGLMIRCLIMPFSFHGHDIFFIYYFPEQWVSHHVWDPYLWLNTTYPHAAENPYYPPVLYWILSLYLALIKPLLPHLTELWKIFESWNFKWEGNTIHYATLFSHVDLFRTLFLFKLPLLISDFLIGFILYKLLKNTSGRIWAYACWMLNPFTLHSAYALGQVDLIYTAWVMIGIYCFIKKKPYLGILCLVLGALIKTIVLLMIPFAVLVVKNTFRERIKLSLWAGFWLMVFISPFLLSSKTAVLSAIFFSPGQVSTLRSIFFFGFYFLLALVFFFHFQKKVFSLYDLISALTLSLLLLFTFQTVTLRFFIAITPLLIFLACNTPRYWIYISFWMVSLFLLKIAGNTQQWGLFSALHPEFFSGLPILDGYLNLIIPIKRLHQLLYRVFLFTNMIFIIDVTLSMFGRKFKYFFPKRVFRYPATALGIVIIYVASSLMGNGFSSVHPKMNFLDIGTHHIPPHFLEVNRDNQVEQSFMSNFNGLFRLTLFIPYQQMTSKLNIVLKDENNQALFTRSLSSDQITPPSHDFYAVPMDAEITPVGFHFPIIFSPIIDSKGKQFVLTLFSNAPPDKGVRIGYWPSWGHSHYYEALTNGSLHINHHDSEGYLAFRTFHTLVSSGTAILQEIKMRLLQDKSFLIIYGMWLCILLMSYLFLFFKTYRRNVHEC